MSGLRLALLICAVAAFLVATLDIKTRFNLIAAGLLFLTLSMATVR